MDRDSRDPNNSPSPLRHNAVLLGVVGMLAALPGTTAHALGISAPQTRSALGQPLELVFPVSLGPNETLALECVHAEVMAGDARVPPSLINIRLEGSNESNVHAVRLQSVTQVNEPIVTVTVALGCPARVTRQYVALIDPPSSVATASVLPPADLPTPEEIRSQGYSPALRAALDASESKPEMLLAQVPASVASAPSRPAPAPRLSGAPRLAASGSAAVPEAAASAPRKTRKRPSPPQEPKAIALADAHASKPARKAEVSRLKLDAPEPVEVPAPKLAAASAATISASAPASTIVEMAATSASAVASDATQDRLAAMEARINQVQKQNQEQQAKLLQLQAELNAAQAQRYQNPLVWVLALLVAALGGLSAYLWRSRKHADEDWWESNRALPAPAPSSPPLSKAVVAPDSELGRGASGLGDFMSAGSTLPMPIGGDDMTEPVPLLADPVSRFGGLDAMRPGDEATMPAALTIERPPGAQDPTAPVTVEELIDMQQQVDFFLVLGQADAAIDLLQSRVSTGASSALPYLKLMEIYQSQGDTDSFAAMAQSFAERFNAMPPAWGGDMNEGRLLEAYEPVLVSVQNVWTDAAVSMALLQNLLTFGPDGDELRGFDLPAYRDLLMLYSVARDLSEHDVRGDQIDLFLPLDSNGKGAATDMMATMAWQHDEDMPAPTKHVAVDLDISLQDTEPAPLDFKSTKPRDFGDSKL